MFTKTLTVLLTALALATTFVPVANAQPNSEAERQWFETAEGRDDGMPRRQ
jgi:hypothetical protein